MENASRYGAVHGLRKLTENYVVDNGKIKRALGIEELPVSSAEGIRRTIRSFGNS